MKRPRIGIFKFTSCDGCQLSILNLEEEISDLIEVFDIAYFREASDRPLKAPLFIALVEGSITTDRQRREIVEVREMARYLITIGACATSGGIQALRNWASLTAYKKEALLETLVSFLIGKRPTIPGYSLCMECKHRSIPCILVSTAEPCLGPITRAGCGAICISFGRPCYGCFGPKEDANIESLLRHFEALGLNQKDCLLLLDKMNSYAYRKAHIEQGRR